MIPQSHNASLVAQMVKTSVQCRRPGFNPWVGKIPWRRKWQPTPVLLPGKFHGLRNPWGRKESDTTEATQHTHRQFVYIYTHINAAMSICPTFLVAQTVKRLPTMQETRVQSLGGEDLLEKEMATHSSTLAWKIPWTEEPISLLCYSPWGRKESDTTE